MGYWLISKLLLADLLGTETLHHLTCYWSKAELRVKKTQLESTAMSYDSKNGSEIGWVTRTQINLERIGAYFVLLIECILKIIQIRPPNEKYYHINSQYQLVAKASVCTRVSTQYTLAWRLINHYRSNCTFYKTIKNGSWYDSLTCMIKDQIYYITRLHKLIKKIIHMMKEAEESEGDIEDKIN